MIRSDYSVIAGGYYNDAVFNSWRLTDEYEAAQSEYDQLRTPVEGETEESQRNRWDRMVVAQRETEAALAYNARTEGLPNNYLVDSRTRTIIAKDLRRHKLDEKLEELLE